MSGCMVPTIVDLVSAKAMARYQGNWVERDWGLPSGKVWREGGAVYTKHSLVAACGIPGKDVILIICQDPKDPKGNIAGLVRDQGRFEKAIKLYSDMWIRRIAVSPKGNLWVIYWNSEIGIFGKEQLEGPLPRD